MTLNYIILGLFCCILAIGIFVILEKIDNGDFNKF